MYLNNLFRKKIKIIQIFIKIKLIKFNYKVIEVIKANLLKYLFNFRLFKIIILLFFHLIVHKIRILVYTTNRQEIKL
jgi:hypothetical protein